MFGDPRMIYHDHRVAQLRSMRQHPITQKLLPSIMVRIFCLIHPINETLCIYAWHYILRFIKLSDTSFRWGPLAVHRIQIHPLIPDNSTTPEVIDCINKPICRTFPML